MWLFSVFVSKGNRENEKKAAKSNKSKETSVARPFIEIKDVFKPSLRILVHSKNTHGIRTTWKKRNCTFLLQCISQRYDKSTVFLSVSSFWRWVVTNNWTHSKWVIKAVSRLNLASSAPDSSHLIGWEGFWLIVLYREIINYYGNEVCTWLTYGNGNTSHNAQYTMHSGQCIKHNDALCL